MVQCCIILNSSFSYLEFVDILTNFKRLKIKIIKIMKYYWAQFTIKKILAENMLGVIYYMEIVPYKLCWAQIYNFFPFWVEIYICPNPNIILLYYDM